jgi:hypothetical protein
VEEFKGQLKEQLIESLNKEILARENQISVPGD